MDKSSVWQDVLNSIKVTVSGANFSTWFTQTHLSDLKKVDSGFIAEIGCKSGFIKNTIESRYYGLIQETLNKTVGEKCDLIFVVKEDPNKIKSQDMVLSPLFETSQNNALHSPEVFPKAKIRPTYTFQNYAVSSSNQMAWAASDAVSRNPGSAYNPLFIWGGVGVGKSHLMNAVGYEILNKNPEAGVYFCTGEDFTNDIVEGIRNKTTQSFRNKYRKLKVLLIDDIQFIAGKDAVQEEFFHTFNALVSNGSQIILTSDRSPSEISKLEERLRSRFEAGLIVDISPPDFELRCAIVQIKSKERNMEIPNEIVQIIAGNLDSPRKIEGFLIRLLSETTLKKLPITQELVESLVGKNPENGSSSSKASPNDIINAVCKHFSLGKKQILGTSRKRTVALPRQILMYYLRTQLSLPLEEVGNLIGGRDHTTVMHAVEKITHLTSQKVEIREDIQGIKKLL
jgi:chromosomal replication initiator protein